MYIGFAEIESTETELAFLYLLCVYVIYFNAVTYGSDIDFSLSGSIYCIDGQVGKYRAGDRGKSIFLLVVDEYSFIYVTGIDISFFIQTNRSDNIPSILFSDEIVMGLVNTV